MTRQQGFTILEVLVALGILVFALMALMQSISSSAKHSHMLDEHTQGYLLASNKLVELQVYQEWPKTGTNTEDIDVNDEKWMVRTKVADGPYPGTRRVDIEAGPKTKNKDDWEPVYSTLTMLGAPPEVSVEQQQEGEEQNNANVRPE